MPQKLIVAMPPDMDLSAQYTIQWAALDPTTGTGVSGVNVSNATMLVTLVGSSTVEALTVSPLWIPLPLDS
jgi:hypothetical protein